MKKAIFGYNIKKTDEYIDIITRQNEALMRHNDYMEDEIKNLTAQLEEANAAVADGMTQSNLDDYRSLKAAYSALQERISLDRNQYKEEIETLNSENASLRKKLAMLEQDLKRK